MRSRPWVRFALLVGSVSLVTATAAGAYPYSVSPPTLVSGPSPFAGCTAGAFDGGVNYPNAEVEPFVAVNPVNAANVIGVFQQDRWSNGGAHGLVAASSFNGGSTWSESFAAFDACSGNPDYDRASDPWVTFDTAGGAYQISLSISADQVTSAILVSKSTDGGVTWASPTTLIRDTDAIHFNDKESITGDPTRAGHVYAVWDRGTFPGDRRSITSEFHSFAYRGQPVFSRTTDGGQTWSPPRALTNQNVFTIGNQIAVLPDGTLVDVFNAGRGSGLQPSPNQRFQGVMLSHDAGVSWSQPIKIANDQSLDVVDPDNGQPVRAGTFIPDIAVDPNTGTIYVVWADSRFSGGQHDDVALSKSSDGGRTWSEPVKVNQTPNAAAAFTPAVAVSADGTVAVSYYDFRNNTPASGLPTDVWMAHSHDGGATWSEQHIGGSFDMETAPVSRGYFTGDYEGLAAIASDFLPFFVMTNSGDVLNRTDVFAVRAAAP